MLVRRAAAALGEGLSPARSLLETEGVIDMESETRYGMVRDAAVALDVCGPADACDMLRGEDGPDGLGRRMAALRAIVGRMQMAAGLGTARRLPALSPAQKRYLIEIDVDGVDRDDWAAAIAALHRSGLAEMRRMPETCGGRAQIEWDAADAGELRRFAGLAPLGAWRSGRRP